MRVTTMRFTSELWAELEREAARESMSVAQYVREAVAFRMAYVARTRRAEVERGSTPKPPH
jgi:predicted DNA-binding ribbon-helix-helix protein